MEEVLKQVNGVAGFVGGLVCDNQGNLMAHDFPPIFDVSMIQAVVASLSDNIAGLEEMTGGVTMIDFRYENGRVLVRPVKGGCLVLLCERTINLQLLAISLYVAIKKLEKLFNSCSPTSLDAPVTTSSLAAPVLTVASSRPVESDNTSRTLRTVEVRDLIDKGSLSKQLQGMQVALAKNLGPIAKIVFFECVEKWLQSNQPDKAAFPQLIDIVLKEIDDPKKGAEYRQRVAHFL